jgi:hypothetical protein
MMEIELLQSSSELVFSAINDNDEESIHTLSEESIANSPIVSPPSIMLTTDTPVQDFDLVKNILSEIFDEPDEEDENPVEEKPSELVTIESQEVPSPININNDEDFRFLDDMLAGSDVTDTDIHQLTPAEIDRVDSLLKQIVDSHQTEATPITNEQEVFSSSSLERPPSPPPLESSLLSTSAGAEAMPIDEELVRAEQEWGQLTEDEKRLGSVAPEWVNDDQAPLCMKCSLKFSITRRRHHCRACGKVFCATCCWQKVKLVHDDNKEDRACNDCVRIINQGIFF